jgi:uncharacterized UPF0160 family protein
MTLFDFWYESLGKESVVEMDRVDDSINVYRELRPVRALSGIITRFDGVFYWDLTE